MGFIARPWLASIAQAQPAPSEKETLVAVDVETLLLRPTSGPSGDFLFGGLKHVAMRQYVALNRHTRGVEDAILGAFKCLARMSHQVWVPRLHTSTVEKEAKLGLLAVQETMKCHRKMRLDTIGELDHVSGGEAIGHDTVQLLPEDNGAVVHLLKRRKQMLRSLRRPFKEWPFGARLLTNEVKIPAQAHDRSAILPTGYSQASSLRETRCLQAQSEAPEVAGGAFCPWVACAEPHPCLQSRVVHAVAVIDDPYPALWTSPFEMNGHLA